MQVILFSHSPEALNLSLGSLKALGPQYDLCTVIYDGSDYSLRKETFEDVLFVEKTDFRSDLLRCRNKVGYTMFMDDNSIFCRQSISAQEIKECFKYFPLASFSLKLGESSWGSPPLFSRFGDFLLCDRTKTETDLDLNCSVFNTDTIFNILENTEFDSLSDISLEGKEMPRYLACCKRGICVQSDSKIGI